MIVGRRREPVALAPRRWLLLVLVVTQFGRFLFFLVNTNLLMVKKHVRGFLSSGASATK